MHLAAYAAAACRVLEVLHRVGDEHFRAINARLSKCIVENPACRPNEGDGRRDLLGRRAVRRRTSTAPSAYLRPAPAGFRSDSGQREHLASAFQSSERSLAMLSVTVIETSMSFEQNICGFCSKRVVATPKNHAGPRFGDCGVVYYLVRAVLRVDEAGPRFSSSMWKEVTQKPAIRGAYRAEPIVPAMRWNHGGERVLQG
ncbi:hypothetical protein ACVDG5_036690 [Mesorhizobium sp. ORM6]